MSFEQQVFFELVKAGLFPVHGEGGMVNGSFPKEVDWNVVYRLAEEQSVVGLVAAGIDAVLGSGLKVKGPPLVPQAVALQFIGQTLQIEQHNKAMNDFVARLIEKLRENDIYAVLVKGQGIAQCYEKPLWRSSGDVDLLLSEDNYEKSKKVLLPLASSVEQEFVFLKHLGMTLDGWEVELHGSQRPRLTKRIDRAVDEVQGEVFYGGKVRSWMNGQTQVFLPAPDEDVIFVFTHILHHYYQEGIGLRQICDWCRLLWTFKDSLDRGLLESCLRKMGLMSEWRAFAAYTVDYLGMPVDAMPLYSSEKKWLKKAKRINDFVLEVGNFGRNRSSLSSDVRPRSFITRKAASLWRRTADSFRHFVTFPKNSMKIWWYMVKTGVMVVRGE